MKVTTLLFSLNPEQFRPIAFKAHLKIHVVLAILYWATGSLILSFTVPTPLSLIVSAGLAIGYLLYAVLLASGASQPKTLLKQNSNIFSRTRIMEFDEDGFSTRFETGSNSYTVWGDTEKATYSDEMTNLYLTKLYIVQVPDSAFPSTRERDQLHTLLRTKSLLK